MTVRSQNIKTLDIAFLSFFAISLAIFSKILIALVTFSVGHEYCSHIILIPAISLWLAYTHRGTIRKAFEPWPLGSVIALPAIPALIWAFARRSTLDPGDFLAIAMFAIVCIWISGFAVCYGLGAFRAGIFPLLFLLLMIPLPVFALNAAVHFLQKGSTEITYWILQAVGQTSLKDGFTIYHPK
jgi:hypothetical protein